VSPCRPAQRHHVRGGNIQRLRHEGAEAGGVEDAAIPTRDAWEAADVVCHVAHGIQRVVTTMRMQLENTSPPARRWLDDFVVGHNRSSRLIPACGEAGVITTMSELPWGVVVGAGKLNVVPSTAQAWRMSRTYPADTFENIHHDTSAELCRPGGRRNWRRHFQILQRNLLSHPGSLMLRRWRRQLTGFQFHGAFHLAMQIVGDALLLMVSVMPLSMSPETSFQPMW